MGYRIIGLLVLVVVLASGAQPVQAFTLKRTQAGGPVRWQDDIAEVELRISPEVETFLAPGETYQAITMAADAWRGFGKVPPIRISEAAAPKYDPEQRGGSIYMLSPWPFEANRLAVTVTSYYPSGRLVGVDVLINGDIDYGLLPETHGEEMPDRFRGKHDLAAVLTHEFGHVLGLDESMDDPHATMWPYIRAGETHQRTLAEDDEEAVIELYDAAVDVPEPVAAPPAACSISVAGASSHAGRSTLGLLVLACASCLLATRRRSARAAMQLR